MANYIFGTGPFAKEVVKRLNSFNISTDGYLKLGDPTKSTEDTIYVDNSTTIDRNSTIFITKKAIIMGETIDFLRRNNFRNIYVFDEELLTEESKTKEELFSYTRKIDLEKPFINYLEVNVVDQCNLNCKGCAHFSNICNNNMLDIDKYSTDLDKIAKHFDVYYFRLLGGEPLLHPRLKDIVELTRQKLPNTKLIIVTNGLLLDRLSIETLQTLAKCNVTFSISLYEPTSKKLDSIIEILNQYNIKYLINDDYTKSPEVIKSFYKSIATTKEENDSYKQCIGRFCRFLRDGKISKCYYPLLIEILNEKYGTSFQVTEDDYIELDNITDGWEAIDKLNGKTPFCDYCRQTQEFFDWEPHHKNEKQLDSFVLQKTINKN